MANLRTNNLSGEGGRNAYRGSVYFGERYSYLQLDGSSDFAFGTTDFTIEAWIKIDDDTNTNAIYDSRPSGSNGAQIALFYSGSSNAILFAHGGTVRITGTKDVGADHSWHHIALTRASGSTKLFVDGVQDGSTYSDSTSYLNPANRPLIGQSGGSTNLDATTFFKGYISNLRVCAGHAVYTANFTPPTSPLTVHHIADDDKTVLLCCQDSDNPLQEATGKTITGFGRYYADTGELFTDTGFNATTGWTGTGAGGWTTTGNGVATHAQGTAGNLTQSISNLVVGQTYKLEVDVVTSDDDVAYFTIEELSPASRALGNGSNAYVGHYEHYFVATATTHTVGFRGSSLFNGTITNLRLQSYGIGLTPKMPKNIPPVGVDAGNTFNGAVSMNSLDWMYFPTGKTEERVIVNNNFGTRGLVFQGLTYPSAPNRTFLNSIEFITVATKGDATDFGDLTNQPNSGSGAGNLTRGIQVAGNIEPGGTNVIQYVTIATTGNATDFGDVGYQLCNSGAVSNQTRLVYSGGESPVSPNPRLNNIEFITFATTGNGTDFGDQMTLVNSPYGVSSPTRGVFMGGSGATPTIQSIQIDTTGDSVLFGDLTQSLYNVRGTITNGHRGVIAGGVISPTGRVNNIEYITIQTGGQSIDFGDLTDARDPSNLSSMTRGVMLSGDYPANVNIMDFIEIMTTGNAVDFGDCNKSAGSSTASNGHGGLADVM